MFDDQSQKETRFKENDRFIRPIKQE